MQQRDIIHRRYKVCLPFLSASPRARPYKIDSLVARNGNEENEFGSVIHAADVVATRRFAERRANLSFA